MLALAEGLNTDESQRLAWAKAVELLIPCQGHLVVSGMGKSGLVGKISATCSGGCPQVFASFRSSAWRPRTDWSQDVALLISILAAPPKRLTWHCICEPMAYPPLG